jgi:ubiquinone/menaquinone biosynthesis C-methylase UbiE
MMPISETQTQKILAVDSFAEKHDDLFARSTIGRAQRRAVWEILSDTFRPGDQILELNSGTADEAFFLGLYLDVSVVACDTSERRIQTVRHRIQAEAPNAPIQIELVLAEHLSKFRPGTLLDGALLNFSGLNIIADLSQAARDMASLVTGGAPVLICLSTRFCLLETLWFLLHGKFRKAFRRSAGIATLQVGDSLINSHYKTLREVSTLFSPFFIMRSCTGIGIVVPPSYLEPVFHKHLQVLELLRLIDRWLSRLPLFRTIGDHMLVHFERVPGRCC